MSGPGAGSPGPEEQPGGRTAPARADSSANFLLGCGVTVLLLFSLGTGAIVVYVLVSLAPASWWR